ncbi:MAG: preprotein translocase subunit SecE [Saprospiraceae bacterium]|jgi:preprotein translocase subunit SecE|nr:preprotein translocase subunit SecE [Saprospiraceae bacterium]
MDNIRLYIKESIHELLNNVTWPTWGELISHTRIVLIATVIFALVTFLMDTISNQALSLIYGLGS